MRAGYYDKGEGGKTITCVLDESEDKKTLDFDYADELQIENPLDIMTEVKITTKGRVAYIDSVHVEFEGLATVKNMPQVDVDWKGDLFVKKEVVQPEKHRKADNSPATSPTAAAFISKSGANLSQALRENMLKPRRSEPQSPSRRIDVKIASSWSRQKE